MQYDVLSYQAASDCRYINPGKQRIYVKISQTVFEVFKVKKMCDVCAAPWSWPEPVWGHLTTCLQRSVRVDPTTTRRTYGVSLYDHNMKHNMRQILTAPVKRSVSMFVKRCLALADRQKRSQSDQITPVLHGYEYR